MRKKPNYKRAAKELMKILDEIEEKKNEIPKQCRKTSIIVRA